MSSEFQICDTPLLTVAVMFDCSGRVKNLPFSSKNLGYLNNLKTKSEILFYGNRMWSLGKSNCWKQLVENLVKLSLKGTVARDCRPLVFFNYRPHMGP